jgi:hypothetical protein
MDGIQHNTQCCLDIVFLKCVFDDVFYSVFFYVAFVFFYISILLFHFIVCEAL